MSLSAFSCVAGVNRQTPAAHEENFFILGVHHEIKKSNP